MVEIQICRMVAVVSVFLIGLVTNRAFILGNLPELHPLTLPFNTSVHVNLTKWRQQDLTLYQLNLLREQRFIEPFMIKSRQSSENFLIVNSIGDRKLLLSSNFYDQASSSNLRELLISTNRGLSLSMFDSPLYRNRLTQLGLTKENAFGCAVNYLLAPKPEIFGTITPTIKEMSRKDVLKIAIHIRTGDNVLIQGKNIDIDFYKDYFTCAKQIQSFASSGRETIFFLFSDSVDLRKKAVNFFDGKTQKLVSPDTIIIEHTSK